MKISKKMVGAVLAGTVALGGLGLVDLPIGPETQQASAATVTNYGVSVNPIKDNFSMATDKQATLSIANSNTDKRVIEVYPQKKQADGTWFQEGSSTLWVYMNAKATAKTGSSLGTAAKNEIHLNNAGTYRYKINVREDTTFEILGTMWSSEFKVTK